MLCVCSVTHGLTVSIVTTSLLLRMLNVCEERSFALECLQHNIEMAGHSSSCSGFPSVFMSRLFRETGCNRDGVSTLAIDYIDSRCHHGVPRLSQNREASRIGCGEARSKNMTKTRKLEEKDCLERDYKDRERINLRRMFLEYPQIINVQEKARAELVSKPQSPLLYSKILLPPCIR